MSPVADSGNGACGKKVVNIVHTQCHMPGPQSQKWSLKPTLDLDSDKFRCRNKLDSFRTSDQSIVAMRAIYSTRLPMELRKPRK